MCAKQTNERRRTAIVAGMMDKATDLALEARLTEAAEREQAIGAILRTMSGSGFDLVELLQSVIESAVRLSHADFGNIARLNVATGLYQQTVYFGDVSPEFWAGLSSIEFGPGRETLIGRTLLGRRPMQIEDVVADPEYDFHVAQQLGGYRSILGVPLLRDGAPIGVIVVNRRAARPFTDHEIAILTMFADQAVLAIANVNLFETVERQRQELARFVPQVADLLSREDGQSLLAGHRRLITALFADLRGFTAFCEVAEPEEYSACFVPITRWWARLCRVPAARLSTSLAMA